LLLQGQQQETVKDK